jgi:predicted small lipoprotein YifL
VSILRRAALAVAVPAVALLAACGNPGPLEVKDALGDKTGAVTVLIDSAALTPVRCAMGSFLDPKWPGIKYAAGSPDQIVTTVKSGLWTDAVVLRAGPALDRLRGELAGPPLPLLATGPTTFSVAAVTDKGLALASSLASRKGRAVLESAPCDVTMTAPASRAL